MAHFPIRSQREDGLMAEYKPMAEALHSLYAELPERMWLNHFHYSNQTEWLGRRIEGFYRMAIARLKVNAADLSEITDDVDDARYPNWALLPAGFRNRVAQLTALFADPERFVPAERLRESGGTFVTLRTRTREIFHEARILLHGNAQRLCLGLEWLQGQEEILEEPDIDQIADVAARTLCSLVDELEAAPALYRVEDWRKPNAAWKDVPKGVRHDVESIRMLCLDPARFVPERNIDQVEDALGHAWEQWQWLLERLGMPK
jgi:hypothetical protein